MPSTAVAKKPAAQLPVSIADMIAAEIAAMAPKVSAPSGDIISCTKNKTFKLPDGRESDGPLPAIIVDFVSANTFYEGKYDPKNPAAPVCFAIGSNIASMKPSNKSSDKQADDCASCPNNAWGSDGSGKACKNTRLLALLPVDFDEKSPLMLIKVSPTAIKKFDAYVNALMTVKKLPAQVVTEISFDQSVDYASLVFGNPVPLEDDRVVEVFNRREAALKRLLTEPDYAPKEASKPSVKGRR